MNKINAVMTENQMNIINHRISKIYLAVILVSVFITGCIQPINLLPMETRNRYSYQEFTIKNYKSSIKLTQIGDDYNYLCSFKLVNNLDGIPVRSIKSTMMVKKYPTRAMRLDRHHHDKWVVLRSIEPIIDTLTHDFDYNYKIQSKGKYELIIKLTEINGKELDKDIQISFDQEVK